MNFTPRQLQAFLLTYELGSFTKAAERMSMSQSAVSLLVGQLEVGLEVSLFDRTTRSVKSTAAADQAAPIARQILSKIDALGECLDARHKKIEGVVNLAVTKATATTWVPDCIEAFDPLYPNIRIMMHEVMPDQIVAMVRNGEVDLGVATAGAEDQEIRLQFLLRQKISAIVARSSDLAMRPFLRWSELGGYKTIGLEQQTGIAKAIEGALRRVNMSFKPDIAVTFAETAAAMAGQGLGLAVLPELHRRLIGELPVVMKDIIDPIVTHDVSVISKADRTLSIAAETFAALLQKIVADGRNVNADPASNTDKTASVNAK